MRRVAILALAASMSMASAQNAEPVPLRLSLAPDLAWRFAETLNGKGTLTRLRGVAQTALAVEVQATSVRSWRFVENAEGGTRLASRSLSAKATLRLIEAPGEGTYHRDRPFRSYNLLTTPFGAILDAELLEPDRADEVGEYEPPVELDMTELFTALELGLLPPGPLAVGGAWQLPAASEEGRRGGLPLQAKGKLLELTEQAGRTTAVLDTSLTAALPARPTPMPELLVSGQVALGARVHFDVSAGRVQKAAGPLSLELRYAYPDARGAVATVKLDLALEARLEPEPPGR